MSVREQPATPDELRRWKGRHSDGQGNLVWSMPDSPPPPESRSVLLALRQTMILWQPGLLGIAMVAMADKPAAWWAYPLGFVAGALLIPVASGAVMLGIELVCLPWRLICRHKGWHYDCPFE